MRHGIKGCETPRLFEKHLDEIFTSILEQFINNKDKLMNTIVNDYINMIKDSNDNKNIESINKKLAEQKNYKERLFEMSLKRMISDEDFIRKNAEIDNNISGLNKELIKLETSKESSSYYENIANEIKNEIRPKLNIKENIGKYFNLFIDKVFVSKINNDRKHIKLEIIFNFKNPNQIVEINENSNGKYSNESNKKRTNRDYNIGLSYDNNFLKQKYLLLNTHVT